MKIRFIDLSPHIEDLEGAFDVHVASVSSGPAVDSVLKALRSSTPENLPTARYQILAAPKNSLQIVDLSASDFASAQEAIDAMSMGFEVAVDARALSYARRCLAAKKAEDV